MDEEQEHPVERKKYRWWPPRRGAVRIFPALRVVGALLFIAVGALLFVASVYYVPPLVLGAATVVAAVVVLIRLGQNYEWTGFGESVQLKPDNQEIQPRKTLWDWLQLLIVPLALAVIGLWFTVQQDARQQEIAEQRAAHEALQAYLDQMGTLLLDQQDPLRNSNEGSEARTLARARTLAVLGILGPDRKRTVVVFLYEADLIQANSPVVLLDEADLSDADLSRATLWGVNLSGANLRNANLQFTTVKGDLSNANPSGANLSDADLSYATLSEANLSNAYLSGANLYGAFGVTQERLEQQASSLEGATMPDGSQHP